MAFNPAPTQLIASWSEDGTNVTFPLASVPELTAAEADATTGDLRKVMFAFCEKFNAWYTALATEDRPTKLTISKQSAMQGDGTYRFSYQLTFNVNVTGQDVSAE